MLPLAVSEGVLCGTVSSSLSPGIGHERGTGELDRETPPLSLSQWRGAWTLLSAAAQLLGPCSPPRLGGEALSSLPPDSLATAHLLSSAWACVLFLLQSWCLTAVRSPTLTPAVEVAWSGCAQTWNSAQVPRGGVFRVQSLVSKFAEL